MPLISGARKAVILPRRIVVAAGALPTWTQLSAPAWQLGGYTATKTFTSVPAGTSGAGRILIIAAAYADTASGTKSCTVNGTGATLVTQSSDTPAITIALWSFSSPGGTATIVIGDSLNFSAAGIFVGELTGVNATASMAGTPQDFGFKSSVISCPALTVPANGFGITATAFQGADPTWGVATSNGASTGATATNAQAYKIMTGYQASSGTPTLTGTSNNFAIVGAAWGP